MTERANDIVENLKTYPSLFHKFHVSICILMSVCNRDLSSHEIARLNGVERASVGSAWRRAVMSSSNAAEMLRGIILVHGAHKTINS